MYKVDIEESPEIAAMFGARGIPYMAFVSENGDITTQSGSLDENTLKYFLPQHVINIQLYLKLFQSSIPIPYFN